MMASTEQREIQKTQTLGPRILVYGDTDVGRVRQNNEDNYLILPERFLFAVSDGMGGAKAGEVASAMALESIGKQAESNPLLLYDAKDPEVSGDKVLHWMAGAIRKSHRGIWKKSQKEAEMRGMGCTLDVLLLASDRAFVGHVGDSRIYLIRRGRAYRVTQDHTLAQAQFAAGFLSEEELKTARTRNILLKAMGVAPEVEPDIFTFEIAPGDRFLLCSDGLYEYLADGEIPAIFEKIPLAEIPRYLINLACERGGHDNITAVVIEVLGEEPSEEELAEVVHALAGVPFLERFTSQELLSLSRIGQLSSFREGEIVVVGGEEPEQLCLVIEGELVEGDRNSGVHAIEGEALGEGALLESRIATYSISAAKESLVFLLDRDRFFRLSEQESVTASKLLWGLISQRAEKFRQRAMTYARRGDGEK